MNTTGREDTSIHILSYHTCHWSAWRGLWWNPSPQEMDREWAESGQKDKMLVFGSFGWTMADWRTLMKSVSSSLICLRMDKMDTAGVFQQILDDGFRLAKEPHFRFISVLTLCWPDIWIRLSNSCCLWRFIHSLADGWEVPNFWWDSLFGGGGWEFALLLCVYGARLMLYIVQCILYCAQCIYGARLMYIDIPYDVHYVSINGVRLMLYIVYCIVHNAYIEPDWWWERGIRSSYQSALHVCLDSYYRTSY